MGTVSAPLPVFVLLSISLGALTVGLAELVRPWLVSAWSARRHRTLHGQAQARLVRFAPPIPLSSEPSAVPQSGTWQRSRSIRDHLALIVAQHPEWTTEQVWTAGVRAGLWVVDGPYAAHRSRNGSRVYRLRKRGLALQQRDAGVHGAAAA